MNTADAHNLVYHERIIPEEFIHFFLMESFNDDEQACMVCIGSPRMTVPFSKSLSINAACSVQHGCSRLVFPAIQVGPGEKNVAKVFFTGFLSALRMMVYFTSISELAEEPFRLLLSNALQNANSAGSPSEKGLLFHAC